ncbi:alpha/beta fold hydrolase [Cohnella endophytica]|uniref:alpha/beta fold hydrolase n=1 Tax=Cohnella endophytica TaxID=2419778 RepID=UPI0013145260|nr:alpha/beta hydrolase [Cohnella endophytica]
MPLIHVNGVELHYHLQGKGTPIVFVHPPCIGSRVFTYLRNDLSQDHKTLLFDFRGHGRSESSKARITIYSLAEDMLRLLDALHIEQAYVCAYSESSFVALQALMTYPNRFVGGILLGGVAEATGWKTRAKLKAGLWAGRLGARGLISFPLSWVHADNHEAFYRIRGETRSGDMRKWREYMESALAYSASKRLKEIKQPMLLLCGQKDAEYKIYMREMQRGLTNFSSAYIPGVGHTLPIYGAAPIGELMRGWVSAQEGQRIQESMRTVHRAAERARPAYEDIVASPRDYDSEQEAQEPYFH